MLDGEVDIAAAGVGGGGSFLRGEGDGNSIAHSVGCGEGSFNVIVNIDGEPVFGIGDVSAFGGFVLRVVSSARAGSWCL